MTHDATLTTAAARWTPEEDATLARLRGQGQTARQIAEVLGRTRKAVLGRGTTIRSAAREAVEVPAAAPTPEPVVEPDPPSDAVRVDRLGRRTWTPSDVARLVEMRGRGLGHDEIATALGRTVDAVTSRVHIIRMGGDDSIRPRKRASRWTPERVAQVRALAAEGLTVHQIAMRVGAHAGGVSRILRSPESGLRPRSLASYDAVSRAASEVERAQAALAEARMRHRQVMEHLVGPVREALVDVGIIALPDPDGDDDGPEAEAAWRLVETLRRRGVELRMGVMTRDEIVARVAHVDPSAEVTFNSNGIPRIVTGASLTEAGLAELFRVVVDAQVAFGVGSPLMDGLADAMATSEPVGPSYELDDLIEDGSWKPGRRPAGWGERP